MHIYIHADARCVLLMDAANTHPAEAADGTNYFIGCCILPPVLTAVLGAVAPPLVPISANILQCWMRNQFAQKFGIETTCIGDAMASLFWPCGMAQITHELNHINGRKL